MRVPDPLTDRLERPLRDLRVSVTDRCNLRCRYCMPREVFGADHAFVPRSQLLTFEEIERVVGVLLGAGVDSVRLTGGEPLVRRDLPQLVRRLAALPGLDDLALTTNGVLLPDLAVPLREAGLGRVTVSLDALDDATFRAVADTTVPVARVLDGLAAARRAGFEVIKLNAVIKRGVNDDQVVELAAFGREHGYTVRFIEYMDVGSTNGWRLDDVVPAAEILERVGAAFPIEPIPAAGLRGTSERFRYLDGAGEVGVVASVTRPFCGDCTRLRLSPVGELFTCLFSARGHDLRGALRGGADDEQLAAMVAGVWRDRDDRYSELRSSETVLLPKVEMSYIGG